MFINVEGILAEIAKMTNAQDGENMRDIKSQWNKKAKHGGNRKFNKLPKKAFVC